MNFVSIVFYRFTDFLVYEVGLDGQVVRIKTLAMPESSPLTDQRPSASIDSVTAPSGIPSTKSTLVQDIETSFVGTEVERGNVNSQQLLHESVSEIKTLEGQEHQEPWPERFNAALAPFLSSDVVAGLKKLFLEGPDPPEATDAGKVRLQGDRAGGSTEANSANTSFPASVSQESTMTSKDNRSKRGHSGKGGRDVRTRKGKTDHRKVLSDVCLLRRFLRLSTS
jgi:tRNA pseudouridine13 synthase